MKGWKTVRLGEVVEEVDRAVPSKSVGEVNLAGVYSFGRGLFRRGPMMPSKTSYKYYNRLVPNDFVLSRPKGWEGAIARVTTEFEGWYLSPVFPAFRCNDSKLLPGFLEWFCKREPVWAMLSRNSRGIGARRETVSPTTFLNLEIPLPPLAEQRRIVARIDALAAEIDEAKRLRQEAVEEAEALYKGLLETWFTPREVAWPSCTVADVIASIDAGWSPHCEKHAATPGEWRVLKTTAVQWDDFQPEQNKQLPPTLSPRPQLGVKKGDVLVTRAGPRKRVGVAAYVREDFPKLMISDKLIRLQVKKNKIDSRFLVLSLCSPTSQEYLVKRKTGLADAQVNISQRILKDTPIPLPPLPEQRRIVAELDDLQAQVDTLKDLQAATSAELDALLPAILDRAFRGEL